MRPAIIARMGSGYLWVKAFHIVFVASWFAGLFYLPRLFVNLAMVAPDSHAERERLLLMARKLYRFSGLLMMPALVLGLVLWLGYGVGLGARQWLDARQAGAGAGGAGLPPCLPPPAATLRAMGQPAQRALVPGLQRDARCCCSPRSSCWWSSSPSDAGGACPCVNAVRRPRWRWSMRRWCCMPACTRSPAGAGRRARRWARCWRCPGRPGATPSTSGPTCSATCRWARCCTWRRCAAGAPAWAALLLAALLAGARCPTPRKWCSSSCPGACRRASIGR